MQYRRFGKTNIQLSALGFGTMRLPIIDNDYGKIDEAEAIKMIRHAIDNGVNYIDTAFMYHEGFSEVVVQKALEDGYREKVYIADKLAMWGCENYQDLEKVFNTQLERLKVDCIDFYLIHCIQSEFWAKREDLQFLKFCDDLKKSGRVKYIGFSFHDKLDIFKEVVDSYDWEFCQIQYNYMNENVQAGTKGLEYAASKGLPVMIMEPLLGGLLSLPPKGIEEVWVESGLNPTDTALKWLWNRPEVTVVLSGMSTMEQVEKNLKSACESGINKLTSEADTTIKNSIKAFNKYMEIPCTKCQYCMSECPKHIEISSVFEFYNFYQVNSVLYPMLYRNIPEDNNAAACINCKKCEKKCPQGIEISKLMPKVHERLKS